MAQVGRCTVSTHVINTLPIIFRPFSIYSTTKLPRDISKQGGRYQFEFEPKYKGQSPPFCLREAFVKICSGREFSSHFTEEVVEISGPVFPIFKINSFFASGKGNRPDVLEISPNLLLGKKMRRLAAFLNYVAGLPPCR